MKSGWYMALLCIVTIFSLAFILIFYQNSQVPLVIYSPEEPSSFLVSSEVQFEKINLNTATKEELMSVPGIGEVTAESIIRYRTENNGFDIIEEFNDVDGIGEKKYETLTPYLTVE